jgi:hypothetical protein
MPRHRKALPRTTTRRLLKQAEPPPVPVRTSDVASSGKPPADEVPSAQTEAQPLDEAIRRMIEAAYT